MKNYRDSDYAANKYANGIVYRFADKTVEVMLEDYLKENPGKTEADFAELKALSDEMYLRQDRADNAQGKKTVSFHALEETEAACLPSAEEVVIDIPEQAAERERRHKLGKQAMDALTDIQRRRYVQHHVDGLSTWEIATMEGVAQRSVMDCIQAAEKKIKKVLMNG